MKQMNRIQKYAVAAGAATTATAAANAGDFYANLNNHSILGDGTITLTATGLNNDFDIRFTAEVGTTTAYCWVRGPNNNLSFMKQGGQQGPADYSVAISSQKSFHLNQNKMELLYSLYNYNPSQQSSGSVGGKWGPLAIGATKYLGMRFGVGGGDYHYGWVEITRSNFSGFADLTLNSWYVNGTVNEGVVAGQQGSNAVPGLGGLAALACGAAGVRRRRNRVA